jgi:hypothetical protein
MIGTAWYMFGCTCSWYRLITGWCMVDALVFMHLYRLITGWCMVDALVYGTG